VKELRADPCEGLLESGVAGWSGETHALREEGSVVELSDEVPVAEF